MAEDGEGMTEGRKHNKNKLKSWKMDKVVNMAARDSDDALVCCVENTVEDHIMDSGASFHATYCEEELERFRLRSCKVCLTYDKTLDIAAVGDVVLKTSFGTSWTRRDVRYIPGLNRRLILVGQLEEEGYHFGVAERLSGTFIAENMGLRAEDPKMLWANSVSAAYLIYRIPYIPIRLHIPEEKWLGKDTSLAHLKAVAQMKCDTSFRIRRVTRQLNKANTEESSDVSRHSREPCRAWIEFKKITQSPGGSSDTSEGSKNIGSFEVSGRSDEDSKGGASSKTCMKIQQRVQGSSKVRNKREKDKIGTKPDKNGKRGEARKSQE
nr:retrovirus-related Pol polyprotein from transposon TNT 1-94 [Tanacetum cinerariifolium]